MEQLGKANVRASELEKQVEKLKKDLAMQIKDKELSEARAHEIGRRLSESNSKADKVSPLPTFFRLFSNQNLECCLIMH